MLAQDDSDWKHDLKVAILTAGLTALATGLVEWAVDELRDRFGTSKPKPGKPEDGKEPPKPSP